MSGNAKVRSSKKNSSNGEGEEDSGSANTSPQGYNWMAIGMLFLFLSVPIFSAVQYVYDSFNPEAANERRIYDNVYKCYNAVGDIDKLNKIDTFISKYQGRERALYNQLRSKYGMEFPECDTFRMS